MDHDQEILIAPLVFSPDNDGMDDYVTISFNLHEPGYMVTIVILSSRGNRVRTLTSNLSVGTESLFIWDGCDGAGHLSAIGMYLFCIDLYHPQGNVKSYRKAITLARRMH